MKDIIPRDCRVMNHGVSSKSSGKKDKLEKEYEMLQKVKNVHGCL